MAILASMRKGPDVTHLPIIDSMEHEEVCWRARLAELKAEMPAPESLIGAHPNYGILSYGAPH